MTFLGDIGMDMAPILTRRTKPSGRVLCRPCLDWSERRLHLAGSLGAALCAHSLDHGWIRRKDGTRAVQATVEGTRVFHQTFGVDLQ